MPLPATLRETEKFTVERITDRRRWTANLFSFRMTRHRSFCFHPGQFARIGHPGDDRKPLWRAYSIVGALLVCGNPEMLENIRALLSSRGLRTTRRGNAGQMACENYW